MFLRLLSALALCLPLVAEWKAVGPFGGAAAVVQVDPHHADVIVAAANNGLLFRSTDAGANWNAVYFPAQLHCTLHSFLIDPLHPDTYFAGVSGDSPQTSGLFRTTDAGATWTLLPGLAAKEVWSVAFAPQDSRTIAAGVHGGVYLTRDGGETWNRISDPSNREMEIVVSLAFDPTDPAVLYAGTPHLPWKTMNSGATWAPVHTGMLDDSDVFSLNVDGARHQRVFASACSGIYSSLNSGATWAKLTGARGASYRTYFVSLDPREPETVFAGTTHGLVRSTDGGKTWRQLSTHNSRWVAFDNHHPGRIYVATEDNGIERSDNEGDTLKAMNEGFCNRHLPMLAVAGGSLYTNTVYENEGGGIFRLGGNASAWEQVAPSKSLLGQQLLSIVPDTTHPQRLFGAGYNSLLLSNDSGKNWSALPSAFSRARVTALYGSQNDPGFVMAATDAGIFRSTDSGKTWKTVPFTAQAMRVNAFVPLEDRQFAAIVPGAVMLSTDGLTWDSTAPLPGNPQIFDVVSSQNVLFAATSLGLMRSEDQAHSWKLVSKGLDRSSVRAICKNPAGTGVLFAAQYGDIFESRDNGQSWKRISPSEPRVSIKSLAILPERADRLYVLTQRQGVFALPLEALASGASSASGSSTGAERGLNEK